MAEDDWKPDTLQQLQDLVDLAWKKKIKNDDEKFDPTRIDEPTTKSNNTNPPPRIIGDKINAIQGRRRNRYGRNRNDRNRRFQRSYRQQRSYSSSPHRGRKFSYKNLRQSTRSIFRGQRSRRGYNPIRRGNNTDDIKLKSITS